MIALTSVGVLSMTAFSLHASDFAEMQETLTITYGQDALYTESVSVGFFQMEAPPGQIDRGYYSVSLTVDNSFMSPSTALIEPVANDILLVERTGYSPVTGRKHVPKALYASTDMETSASPPGALLAINLVDDALPSLTSFARKEVLVLNSGTGIVFTNVSIVDYEVAFYYQSHRDGTSQVAYNGVGLEKFEFG